MLQTSAFVPAFPVSHLLVISYDVRAKHSARPAHHPSNPSILIGLLTTRADRALDFPLLYEELPRTFLHFLCT